MESVLRAVLRACPCSRCVQGEFDRCFWSVLVDYYDGLYALFLVGENGGYLD